MFIQATLNKLLPNHGTNKPKCTCFSKNNHWRQKDVITLMMAFTKEIFEIINNYTTGEKQ